MSTKSREIAGRKYVLLEDVAKEINVSNRTLVALIKSDKLKGNKIGRQWLIQEESLDKFLNS